MLSRTITVTFCLATVAVLVACSVAEPVAPATTAADLPVEPAPARASPTPTPPPASATPAPTITATLTSVPEPTAAPTAAPTATATASEPQPSAASPQETAATAAAEQITIAGAGELALHATFVAPAAGYPVPGVILLHMLGDRRQVWSDIGLQEALVANGLAVLALDMRGHGETGGSADWWLAAKDLQQVWLYLVQRPEVDPDRTAYVGAAIGANLAFQAGAREPAVRALVLLSPEIDYLGVVLYQEDVTAYGDRPMLIVANGRYGAELVASRSLADQALGPTRVEIYEGVGQGTDMFSGEPELSDLIVGWLGEQLGS